MLCSHPCALDLSDSEEPLSLSLSLNSSLSQIMACVSCILLCLTLCFCFAVAEISSSSSSDDQNDIVMSSRELLFSEEHLLRLFEQWTFKHAKNYSAHEKHERFRIFKDNLFYAHTHNARLVADTDHGRRRPYRLGLNQFADLTLEEFKLKHLGFLPRSASLKSSTGPDDHRYPPVCSRLSFPKSVDWRHMGAVTPVKDQGQCGSCWAFSSTGAMEGAYAISNGKLISLSEQELVSCAKNNYGCDGGLMDPAFEWVIKNGGINSEQAYPYVSTYGNTRMCNWILKQRKVMTIDGYEDVKPDDEDALMCAVAKQPVSVAINAGTRDFQLYADGVFSGSCSDDPNDIDHAVLAVGYGSKGGKDYWIVKNSWSESWGMDGYVHIARSTGNVRGVCGIHSVPSYPVVKGSRASDISFSSVM